MDEPVEACDPQVPEALEHSVNVGTHDCPRNRTQLSYRKFLSRIQLPVGSAKVSFRLVVVVFLKVNVRPEDSPEVR